MVWTMINLLILFDTEFKVSDFFFPDIAFVRMYMDGAGMILFHSSRGFLGFVCFFFIAVWWGLYFVRIIYLEVFLVL